MTFSIIIPVLYEAGTINAFVARLRAYIPPGSEIIVVDGDPADSTIRAVRDERVVTATANPGRGNQMNKGAELAGGDILLFLHADTELPDAAFDRIRIALADGNFVGGCFSLGIMSNRRIFRITERYVALRTRLTKIPFGDQAIFLRRVYFEHIGGYRNIPIMEDVELMGRIRKRGDRISILPERVMTSPRRWEKEGVLRTTMRNWMLQVLYACGVSPERLSRFYKS